MAVMHTPYRQEQPGNDIDITILKRDIPCVCLDLGAIGVLARRILA